MAFQWRRFLDANGIDYVERGANVGRGNLGLRCPFCGDDPSHHLGVSLTSTKWNCWRCSNGGIRPTALIRELLGCGWDTAEAIANEANVSPPADSWADLRARLVREAVEPERALDEVDAPPESFSVADYGTGPRSAFLRFLRMRKFRDPADVANAYGLRGALSGRWDRRLLFPLRDEDGRTVGWTGRAIGRRAKLRYLTECADVGRVLYLADEARVGGRTLVVTEGPIDALKIDVYGRPAVRAVALLGLSLTAARAAILARLSDGFLRIAVLLDPEAGPAARRLAARLGDLRLPVSVAGLPEGVEDPGDLTRSGVRKLAARL